MEEILKSYGFKYNGGCSCGGVLTKNYFKQINHKRIEVKIFPNKHSFDIRINNSRIDSGKEEQLTYKLKEHEII